MAQKYFWKNKWIFILAAIGSAAGLGNLWRFPFKVYDNGGAAFIVAYLIMLLLIGVGLLIGEVALGQKNQNGAPGSFGGVNRFLKWIGWSAILIGAVIVSYYAVVIAWGMDYLWYSIVSLFTGGGLIWEQASSTSSFFFDNVLHLSDGVASLGSISIPVLIGLVITWILIYLFTFKSAKSVGKVITVTATLPIITLIILAIRGITLPGGIEGVQYLFSVDWSMLSNFNIWSAAAGQIFFTLSLSMGIMIAYGALKQPKSEIVSSSVLVVLGNTLVSIISAIAVFGTLGYLSQKNGVPIDEVVGGGPSLVFVTFPEILSKLPALNSLFAVIFFGTVFLLAVDSAMSLVESVSTALRDKFKKLGVEKITLIISIIIGLGGLTFTFGNGLYLLDIVDHYITSLGMVTVGMFSALTFIYSWKSLTRFIDQRNDCLAKFIINKWYLAVSWIISLSALIYLMYSNFADGILKYSDYSANYLTMYGIYTVIAIFAIGILLNILEEWKTKK